MSVIDRSQAPAPTAVRDFVFPEIKHSELANGLQLFAVPHGTLPLITFRVVVHAGAEHDTRERAGIAYLTANVLEAGTRTRSADRLAWDFEKIGAELDIDVVWDFAALTVTVPADRAEAAIALLAEVVLEPALQPEEIDRLRAEQLAVLMQREADPRAHANDQALRFIFDAASPYSRPLPGVSDSLRAITADDVAGFLETNWTSANAALVAVGAIDEAALRDLASRHFGNWSGERHAASPSTNAAARAARINLVHRPGAVQSEIRVGHVGLPRKTPDYYPLVIANNILGGAFTSRLNMNLREKNGFTYGVRSSFAFRKHPGPFTIQTAVATDVTIRALTEIRNETEMLLRDGPTEEEVRAARDYLSGTIPLELETTEQIAVHAGEIFVFDLPLNYYSLHRDRLRSVTLEQAADAARKNVRMDDFIITIVGDAEALEQELNALNIGNVVVHENND